MIHRIFRGTYQRAIKAQQHRGYNEIYDDLISVWSQEAVWSAGLFAMFLFVYLYLLPLATQSFTIRTVLVVILGLSGFAVLGTFVLLIYTLALSVILSPLREVPTLAVRIMTSVNKPYSQPYTGLNYREISHLRKVAEIEQGSAEWRSSFVNFVIIGTVSVIVWGAPFLWSFFSEPTSSSPMDPDYQRYEAAIASYLPDSTTDGTFYLIAGGIFIILLVTSFLSYFRRFLSGEAANRVVLKACEEASAFLEKYNLTEHTVFTYYEKRAIAAHFGCKLVPSEESTLGDQLWTWGNEPDGMIWYLIPSARNSRVQNFRMILLGARLWISKINFKRARS